MTREPYIDEELLVPLDSERGIRYRGRRAPFSAKIEWDNGREVLLTDTDRQRLAQHPAPAVARPAPRVVEDPWLAQARIHREETDRLLAQIQALVEKDGAAIDAHAARETERRRPRPEEEMQRRAASFGVPQKLAAALGARPQDRPALRAVRAWWESGQTALLLYGASQAGKSFAAARWLTSCEDGLFCSGPDLELATRYGSGEAGTAYLQRARAAPFLVIDECAGKIGTPAMEQVDTLICQAFDRRRRLIITCNALTKEDFFGFFGSGDRNRVEARFLGAGRTEKSIVKIGPWTGGCP